MRKEKNGRKCSLTWMENTLYVLCQNMCDGETYSTLFYKFLFYYLFMKVFFHVCVQF